MVGSIATGAASQVTQVIVVDSALGEAWNPMAESARHFTVAILTDTGVDTLRHVIEPLPILQTESVVAGVAFDTVAHGRRLFRYDVDARAVTYAPLPQDVGFFFHDVSVSPNGQFVLYLARGIGDMEGKERFVIVPWEGTLPVISGPWWDGCDCDVDRYHARWISADRFQVAKSVGRRSWARITGSLVDGQFVTDSVDAEPDWHRY